MSYSCSCDKIGLVKGVETADVKFAAARDKVDPAHAAEAVEQVVHVDPRADIEKKKTRLDVADVPGKPLLGAEAISISVPFRYKSSDSDVHLQDETELIS